MVDVLLIQLPVPQLNFGHQTANIPFGAACLKQAAERLSGVRVDILPQSVASYSGDGALLSYIENRRPDIIGFSVYAWNVRRTMWLARRIKSLYPARVVVGGPEVTPDNPILMEDCIDFRVYGEGEELFIRLLEDPELWLQGHGSLLLENRFCSSPSPYFTVLLEPELEGIMLLETMRGCPYRCAYCYYNKSHERLKFKDDRLVLDAIGWALSNGVKEVYFLDPSLDSRPGLKNLLKEIAGLNSDRRLFFISEIRADAVDGELADLLAAAGFSWLEVGLQTCNPEALKIMRRKTDLERFASGVHGLMERGIEVGVDLIVGLPGDDPDGFDRTTRFVVDNDLDRDIQVFPLSLLPGTEFRRRHKELGLAYDPEPPYIVLSTPGFTQTQILEAFELAQERFEVAFYPFPDLDLSYLTDNRTDIENAADVSVRVGETSLHYKVVLNRKCGQAKWHEKAGQVTHPYQLLIPPSTDFETVSAALSVFTRANPFVPLELVFFSPPVEPDVQRLLSAARLARPHYLDNDLRMLYREPGNRSILFTVVSQHEKAFFGGPMQRHIYWWRGGDLPDMKHIAEFESCGFDGILIDPDLSFEQVEQWQERMAPMADDLILVGFAWTRLQKRWLELTAGEDYCLSILP